MSTIIEEIRHTHKIERLNRNAGNVAFLSFLLAEIERVGKDAMREVTDADCIAVMQKLMKGLNETLTHKPGDERSLKDVELLKEFLPGQLSESALNEELDKIITDVGTNIGKIMGTLKANFNGQYDPKHASELVKRKLGSIVK